MPFISSLIKTEQDLLYFLCGFIIAVHFIIVFYSGPDGFEVIPIALALSLDIFLRIIPGWKWHFALSVGVDVLHFPNYKASILLIAASFILSGIVAQILKHIFPFATPRLTS